MRRLFEHDVRPTELSQPTTRREPRLPGADDQGLCLDQSSDSVGRASPASLSYVSPGAFAAVQSRLYNSEAQVDVVH